MPAVRSLGARFTRLEARKAVPAIVEFARANSVTQIFVGHSLEAGWRSYLTRGTLDRLISAAEGMDVRIFPHADEP